MARLSPEAGVGSTWRSMGPYPSKRTWLRHRPRLSADRQESPPRQQASAAQGPSQTWYQRIGKVTLLAILACATLALLETVTGLQARNGQLQDATLKADNLAQAVAQQAERSFETLALVTSGIVERLEHDPQTRETKARLHEILTQRTRELPQLFFLAVVDAQGNWRSSSGDRTFVGNVSDRPYFQYHRDTPGPAFHLGGLVTSRINGRTMITASRRYDNPDGSFSGIVVGSVEIEYFQKFYDTLALNPGDVVALFNGDSTQLVRHPATETGGLRSGAHLFQLMELGAMSGSFTTSSVIDHVTRIYTYRRLADPALVAVAALSVDQALADWRRDMLWHFLGACCGCFLLIGLAIRFDRQIRRSSSIQQQIAQANADYRLLAENSTDMIFRARMDFTWAYVSPASGEILGLPPERLVETSLLDRIHRDDRPAVITTCRSLSTGTDRATMVARMQTTDGRWVWVESELRVAQDDAGQPVEIIGALRDITARKAAEAREEQALMQAARALECTTDYVFAVDFDWNITYFNNHAIDHLGLDYNPVGAGLWAIFPKMRDTSFGQLYERVMAQRQPGMIEDFYEPLGTWYEAHVYPGNYGLVVYFRDVSARRTAEEQLRASEAHLGLVLKAADLGTWLMDLSAGTHLVNDRWLELAGQTRACFNETSKYFWTLIHPDDGEAVKRAFRHHVAKRTPLYECEMRLKQPDGTWRWILSRGAVVEWTEDGHPKIASGTVWDITERRRLADELAAARDAADEANRAKSSFLASMSHEIRTPMNGIVGFAELLLDGQLAPEQQRNAMLLKDAGQSLLTIINDILDVSKIEAGKLDLERIPMSLASIADSTMAIMRTQAEKQGLELDLVLDDDLPPWVLGDPTRLRQILLNLTGNALKFTEEGNVVVLMTREQLDGRELVRVEVRDTGIGIPADRLDRLFRTFSQADSSTTRRFGGTGLGLAICKRLVEGMGGEIGVVSEPGIGSVFWFTMALEAADAPARTAHQDRALAARPARILVAEDVTMNQIIVDSMLSAAGHEVVLVDNGAEALEAVQQGTFDMVLMDMQMPVMDGVEAATRIRALDGPECEIPIIALSANAMAEEILTCRAAGMNAHLAKPIDREALLKTVAEWTGRGTRVMEAA